MHMLLSRSNSSSTTHTLSLSVSAALAMPACQMMPQLLNRIFIMETVIPAEDVNMRVMARANSPLKGRKRSKKKEQRNPSSYCLCGYGDGVMIGCDGESCEGNNWYHLECLQEKLGISEQRSKRLRGNWFCPSCTEKAAKIQEKQEQKQNLTKTSTAHMRSLYETEYVLSPTDKGTVTKKSGAGSRLSSLPPLRVESAERQSREEMESLMSTARLLKFEANGCVVTNHTEGVGGGGEGTTIDFPRGLSLVSLTTPVFTALQSLHEVVVSALEAERRLTPWAGVGESDARKRGYAFLPSRFGKFGKSTLSTAGVRFHAAEKKGNEAKKDETANWQSCFRLTNAQITPEHESGLRPWLLWFLRGIRHVSLWTSCKRYSPICTMEEIICQFI